MQKNKIKGLEYKNTFRSYGEYCHEMRRNSALNCEPNIYDEDNYCLSHSILNPAKRDILLMKMNPKYSGDQSNEMWSDEVQN